MVGHRGHIQADEFRQISYAPLTRTERIDDEKAVGIAQRLEDLRPFAEISRGFALGGFAGGFHAFTLCQLSK